MRMRVLLLITGKVLVQFPIFWNVSKSNQSNFLRYGTSGPEFERHKLDYIKLYVDTIHDEFLTHGTQQPFLVSSPSNASLTEKKGWISMDPKPSDPRYGTGNVTEVIILWKSTREIASGISY